MTTERTLLVDDTTWGVERVKINAMTEALYDDKHDHSNIEIIDEITAAYTEESETKLDGIAEDATANSTDVYLLNVDNHTSGDINEVFTIERGDKIDTIEEGATANSTDTYLLNVDNHTSGGVNEVFTQSYKTKLANMTDSWKGVYDDETAINDAIPSPSSGYACWNLETSTLWSESSGSWVDSTVSSVGDMLMGVYDPQSIASDAFDRTNHTGVQTIATVTDLQTTLDEKATYAGDLDESTVTDDTAVVVGIRGTSVSSNTPEDDDVLKYDADSDMYYPTILSQIGDEDDATSYLKSDSTAISGSLTDVNRLYIDADSSILRDEHGSAGEGASITLSGGEVSITATGSSDESVKIECTADRTIFISPDSTYQVRLTESSGLQQSEDSGVTWGAIGSGLYVTFLDYTDTGTTLSTGLVYYIDTTLGETAIVLPTTDVDTGAIIDIQDSGLTWGVYNVTITTEDDSTIDTNVLDITAMTVQCVYDGSNWVVYSTGYSGLTENTTSYTTGVTLSSALISYNPSEDETITAGDAIPFDAIDSSINTGTDPISNSSGVITIPYGYKYRIMSYAGDVTSGGSSGFYIYSNETSAQIGTMGQLTMNAQTSNVNIAPAVAYLDLTETYSDITIYVTATNDLDFSTVVDATRFNILVEQLSEKTAIILGAEELAITNPSATDGYFLKSNGDGTATFEVEDLSISNSASATDGYVLTSNGDGTATFEATDLTVTNNSGASDGYLLTSNGDGTATFEATTNMLKLVYPVGSIYIAAVSTSPASLFGFGTWTAHAEGRVLVGVGTGTDTNSNTDSITLNETGGEYKHKLTTTEMPSHRHSIPADYGGDVTSASSGDKVLYNSDGSTAVDYTNYTGSTGYHNNTQPYIGVYMWKRTA